MDLQAHQDRLGLQRVVLIDTNAVGVSGKFIEFNFTDHASVSGANGAGKTTVMKMIPFFYGASPAQLMPRIGVKKSFVDFMFPRPSSMIVFEYRGYRALCCVVVYRQKGADKPAYRFVNSPYRQALFEEDIDGVAHIIEASALPSAWTQLSIQYSNQIENVIDYKAIIQNNTTLLARSAERTTLQRLANLYAISSRHNSVRSMDSITRTILNRISSIDDIRQLLADIMKDNGTELPQPLALKRLAETIDAADVLRQLDEQLPAFENTIDAGLRYSENRAVLVEIAAQIRANADQLNEQKSETIKRKKSLEQQADDNEQTWREREGELHSAIAKAKAQKHQLDIELDALVAARHHWDDQSIEQKRSEFASLAALREACEQAKNHYDDLTSSVAHVKNQKEARIEQVRRGAEAQQKQIEHVLGEIKELRWRLKQDQTTRQASIRDEYSVAKSEGDLLWNEQLTDLREQIARLEQASERPSFIDAEHKRIEQLQAVVDGAKNTHSQLAEKEKLAAKALSTAIERLTDIRQGAAQIRLKIEQLTSEQARLNEQLNPDTSSWLYSIQQQDPRWYAGIGKVVRPDVLLQKRLPHHQAEEFHQTILGWHVELDRIEQPPFTGAEQALRDELDKREKLRVQLESEAQSIARKLKDQDRDLAIRQVEHNSQCRALEQAQDELQTKEQALRQARNECDRAAASRQSDAAEQLRRVREQLKQKRNDQTRWHSDLQEQFDQQRQEIISYYATEFSTLDERDTLESVKLKDINKRQREDIANIEKWYQTELSDKGIDERIEEEARIKWVTVKERYTQVKNYREQIDKYEHWLANRWSQYETLTDTQRQADKQLLQHQGQLRTEKEQIGKLRQLLESERAELARSIVQIDEQLQQCRQALEQREMPAQQIPHAVDIDQEHELLINRANTYCQQQRELMESIRRGCEKADNILCYVSPSNEIRKAWDAHRANVRASMTQLDRDTEALAMVGALQQLISEQLPQTREGCLLDISNAAEALTKFRNDLKETQRAIAEHARKISQNIDSTMTFHAISDVSLELVSRIDAQDYWRDLCAFVSDWQSWLVERINHPIPPKRLTDELLALSKMIGRSAANDQLQNMFELSIHLKENGASVKVATSAELEALSSNGLAYLVLMSVYAGITRMLCNDKQVIIHWPVDELGVLSAENIQALFEMFNRSNIVMVSGFPSSDPALLQHFTHKHPLEHGVGVLQIQTQDDPLSALLAAEEV